MSEWYDRPRCKECKEYEAACECDDGPHIDDPAYISDPVERLRVTQEAQARASAHTARVVKGGRPALSTEKLRSNKVLVSLNAAELANLDAKREPGEARAVCLRRLAEVE